MIPTLGICTTGLGLYGLRKTYKSYNLVQEVKKELSDSCDKTDSKLTSFNNNNMAILNVYKQIKTHIYNGDKIDTIYQWNKINTMVTGHKETSGMNVLFDHRIKPIITTSKDTFSLHEYCKQTHNVWLPLCSDDSLYKLTYQKVSNSSILYKYVNYGDPVIIGYNKQVVVDEVHKGDDDLILTYGFGSLVCVFIGTVLILNPKH